MLWNAAKRYSGKREYKEKLHRKRKKETKIREFFKASLAA
jgi:hypothetical protein